jgi:hypothetical protein
MASHLLAVFLFVEHSVCSVHFNSLIPINSSSFFFKKRIKKIKIRKMGASWEYFEKWAPPAR